jgi:hypothetical protein
VTTSKDQNGAEEKIGGESMTGASPLAQPLLTGNFLEEEKSRQEQQGALAGMEFTPVAPDDPMAQDLRKAQTTKGVRMPVDFSMPEGWIIHASKLRPDLSAEQIRAIGEKFKLYWVSVSGKEGLKQNWLATWINWIKNERNFPSGSSRNGSRHDKGIGNSKIIEPSKFDNDQTRKETLALVQKYGATLTASWAKKKN